MRWLALAALLLPAPGLADEALTLDAALRGALERSPALAASDAAVREAEARAVSAGTYPFDPELRGEAGARRRPDDTAVDWALEIAQTVELAGQTRRRATVAEAGVAQARAERDLARRALVARVRLAYVDAAHARDLLQIEASQAALARELATVVDRRVEAGDAARVERNVARAEAGRAEARVHVAEGRYRVARGALAEAVGLGAGAAPEPADPLESPAAAAVAPVPELLGLARARRAEPVALSAALAAARARRQAADAEAVPDLGVAAFVRREGGRETILGAGLSIPLPIIDRKQGPAGEARAEADRLEAESAAAALEIERQVVAAAAELDAATRAAEALRRNVVGTLEESAGLLRQAAEAGKVGAADVLLLRQQARDAARELLDAVADAARARIVLDLATGAGDGVPAGE